MNKFSLKIPLVLTLVAVLLAVSISNVPTSILYAYIEFDVSNPVAPQDSYITSSQSSSQGSYCYAPPNATIINSCNSGDISSSENTGLNLYGQ